MRKLVPLLAALLLGLLPSTARADGFGVLGGTPSFADPPYRYVALTPHTRHPLSVIERIDLRDSTVDRWWFLHGTYYLPAVAYDGSPGGISANGVLVLSTMPRSYPPKRSAFAVLDTRLFLSHPHRDEDSPRHAITRFSLPGSYSFDAISPDGSRIYLIHNLYRGKRLTHYEVRALDTASGRLLPRPIVDPEEPEERMQGSPVSRASSPDGRWAYTLYAGSKERFLHALDTVRGRAVCVDLPQLEDLREPFQLRLRLAEDGRKILVTSRDRRDAGPLPLLEVDTESFEVRTPPTPLDLFASLLSMF